MTRIAFLKELMPILYPKFYTVFNYQQKELVFLDVGVRHLPDRMIKETETMIVDFIGEDKTKCEATENHFHLFEKIGEANKAQAVEIGKSIAANLLNALTQSFPNKNFVVYLEVNVKDSVIIRFHQRWENEPPYFDMAYSYKDVELFEFKNK